MYALFHKLFGAAPDAAVLEALLGGATADAVDEYAEDDETMRGFGRFLSDLAAAEGRATLLEAARDEHVRVLVGPGALPALPWEAPHRSGEPTVFQEGTLAVRAAYRARGVQPRKLQRVPDDHVALECAFMAREARFSLAQLIAGDVRELAGRAARAAVLRRRAYDSVAGRVREGPAPLCDGGALPASGRGAGRVRRP